MNGVENWPGVLAGFEARIGWPSGAAKALFYKVQVRYVSPHLAVSLKGTVEKLLINEIPMASSI